MVDRRRETSRGFRAWGRARTLTVRHRRTVGLWVLIVMLGALGCTTIAPAPQRGAHSPYVVGAPDQLSIQILPDPVVTLDVTVRPDGMISVPLIGEVTAAGLTIPQIAADIETRMSKFKRGAQVTVMLLAAVHTGITVLGEVVRSASFPLVKDTRVVEAIAQVGGPTTFAWSGRIKVIRSHNGKTEVLRVDLTEIRQGDLRTNLLLEPGDIIYVPPTILARIGYAINAVFFPFQPILGLARAGATAGIP